MPIRWPSKSATVAVVLVPLRAGSSSTSSAIRSCARCRAPATWPSRSSLGVASRRRSCRTAVLEATSPRAAPPTPSQTASRCGPAYPESWLSLRTRPTSEIAAKSRRSRTAGAAVAGPASGVGSAALPGRVSGVGSVIGLLLQLEDRLADAHLGAQRDRGGLGDPHRADVGAVGGAEVLDEPLVAGRGDPGVPGGDVVVVEADRRVVAAADQDRRLVELGAVTGVRALGDQHVGGGAAAPRRRLGGLGGLPA